MTQPFDAARDHRFADTRWFEDFRLGEKFWTGDTLYPMLEITELEPQNTTGVVSMRATVHNQRNELVLEGMHRHLIRRRPSV